MEGMQKLLGGVGWGGGLDIEKALLTTSSTGGNLIPEVIDPYITELALQHAPLRSLVPRTPWTSKTYDKNQRTAFGQGRFVPEDASPPEVASTVTRFQETMRILSYKGAVSGFQQYSSQDLLDVLQFEIEGGTIASNYEEEYGFVWGNGEADTNVFKGLDYWTTTGNSNLYLGAGSAATLAQLDTMIDGIQTRGVILNPTNSFFMCSHKMLSFLSSLDATKQNFNDIVEIDAGFRFRSYRGIPFVESSFLAAPTAAPTTFSATGSDSGGTMTVDKYYYSISAITQTGESIGATETDGDVGAVTVGKVTLAWDAPTVAGSVRAYKIYRGLATGDLVHYTTIPGTTAAVDSLGFQTLTDVTEWIDNGVRTAKTVGTGTITGATYVPGYTNTGMDELLTLEEDIYLICTGVPGIEGPTLSIPTLRPMSYMPLAQISDKMWFLILQYACMVCIEQFQARTTRVKAAA